MTDNEKPIWRLWECLPVDTVTELRKYQRKHHGLKLDLMSDPYGEVESLQEIDKLMQEPTKLRRPPK